MTRGRRPNTVPTVATNIHFPEPVRARMDLHLFSEVEGRVPLGAYQRVLTPLVQDFFDTQLLDLAPYLNTLPGQAYIRGKPDVIEALKRKLETPNL